MKMWLVEVEKIEKNSEGEKVPVCYFYSFLAESLVKAYEEAKRLYWWPINNLVEIPGVSHVEQT